MLKTLKEKAAVLVDKVVTTKNAVVIGMYTTATLAHAQVGGSGGAAQQSAQKLTSTMQAFLGLMPIAARIAGLIVLIGGMWSLYKYYKSQGRDGSVAAGVAGLGVGAGLFFLGGLLNLGADTIGIDKSAMPQ